MTAIYTKGDFSQARVVDYNVSYPMSQYGDTSTKLYSLVCVVNANDYTIPFSSSSLSSASSVGVIELPITDSTARYVGDTSSSISGGKLQFVRRYAEIPNSRTELSTGIYTSPPQFGTKVEPTLFSTINGNPLRTRRFEYVRVPSKSEVVPVRLEYSYGTYTLAGTIKTQESFTLEKTDSTTSRTRYLGYDVTEVDEGATTVTITGDGGVIVGTQIRRWMGEIFEKVTGYRT